VLLRIFRFAANGIASLETTYREKSIVFGCEILDNNLQMDKDYLVRGCYEWHII
jgi:hypothetical protein